MRLLKLRNGPARTRAPRSNTRRTEMPKFAANLSMLFTEVPFPERFAAAARAGFRGVEYLFPYAMAKEDIAGRLNANGLTQVLFNLPAGDWDAGEREIASPNSRTASRRRSNMRRL